MMRADKPQEECGVVGLYAPNDDVARLTFFGLHALQHRGQGNCEAPAGRTGRTGEAAEAADAGVAPRLWSGTQRNNQGAKSGRQCQISCSLLAGIQTLLHRFRRQVRFQVRVAWLGALHSCRRRRLS